MTTKTTWIFLLLSLAAGAQKITPASSTAASEEYLLLGSANRGAGEPVIVINPGDPNNILIEAMGNLHYMGPVQPAKAHTFPNGEFTPSRIQHLNTQDATKTLMAVSTDRGKTWTFSEDPMRAYFKRSRCPDPFVGASFDQTLYAGCESTEIGTPGPGSSNLIWSTDKGRTWSTPVEIHSSFWPKETYALGLKPVIYGSSPWDRPWIEIDEKTGTLYVQATGQNPPGRQSYIRASHDKGKTWGTIYSFDSEDYRQSGGGRSAAAGGVLAVVYIGSAPGAKTKCPCAIFGVSKDDGKTFERRIIQQIAIERARNISLVADHSHPGRFAVMVSDAANKELRVNMTNDFGENWTAQIIAGTVPGTTIDKPAVRYSPKGKLAIAWRAIRPDGFYEAWSALSNDGGRSFSAPLKISHALSPPLIPERGNYLSGDDNSSVDVDGEFVHFVWADSRTGFLGTWYGRVPLEAYGQGGQ